MQQNHINLVTAIASAILGVSSLIAAELPAEYRRVDYVETWGNQWIDTGYYPGPQTIVEGDVQMVGSCSLTADGSPFGATEAIDRFCVNFGNDSSDHLLTWCGPEGQKTEQVWGGRMPSMARVPSLGSIP